MFRLNFAYMSLYQVLEYHMEFLETFGCIWSSKEVIKVIIGRAMHGSDLLERRHELARQLSFGATSQSDTLRSLASMVSEQAGSDVFRATQQGRSQGDDSGATSSERHSQVAREETTRERPLTATSRGRSASICLAEFMFSQGPFGHFIMHVFTFQNLCFKYLLQPAGRLSFILEKNNQKPLGKVYLFDSLDHMLFC